MPLTKGNLAFVQHNYCNCIQRFGKRSGNGETKVIVTTEDGGFKDTCVVIVEEKSVVIVHPEVLEADELLESDYMFRLSHLF